MSEIPKIELRIQIPQQQLIQGIAAYQEDIAKEVQRGIEDALSNFSKKVEGVAFEKTENFIEDWLDSYFESEGDSILRAMLGQAMSRIDIKATFKKEYNAE